MDALPIPDLPLLRKAISWAEAEAAKTDGTGLWNQDIYAKETDCGTTYCIAGYVVSVAGPSTQTVVRGHAGHLNLVIDGEWTHWGDEAQRLLGLTFEERCELFLNSRSLDEVREAAQMIAKRAGEEL